MMLIVAISLFSCAYDELGNGEEIKTAINVSTFSANDIGRTKINVADIPDGIDPLVFDSEDEALAYFQNNMQLLYQELPHKDGGNFVHKSEKKFPLLKTRSESSNLPPSQGIQHVDYFAGLITVNVSLQWENTLGPIDVNSWLGGVTIGSGWEQQNAEANWVYDGENDRWGIYYHIIATYKPI